MKLPNVLVRPVDNRDRKGGGNVYGPGNLFYETARDVGLSYEWESFDKFADDVKVLSNTTRHNPSSVSGGPMNGNWLGVPGGDGYTLMKKVEHGWPELRRELERMLEECELDTPPVPSRALLRRRKRTRADHGDTLDMGRVWNGDMERAWEVPKRSDVHTITTKRVTLAIDVTANGGISHRESMWRSALGMKLVDSLIKAGKVLEIWVIDSSSHPWMDGTQGSLWAGWCIKKSSEPVVMDRLCSMLTVGFMRVCGFLAMHAEGRSTSYGGALNFGLPATLKDRQNAGELVLRVGECYSQQAMINEYNRAWMEVIKHSAEVIHGIGHGEAA